MLGFPVSLIVGCVQVMAGRADRFMSEVVVDMAQIDVLVSHVRSCGVPQPMDGAMACNDPREARFLELAVHVAGIHECTVRHTPDHVIQDLEAGMRQGNTAQLKTMYEPAGAYR